MMFLAILYLSAVSVTSALASAKNRGHTRQQYKTGSSEPATFLSGLLNTDTTHPFGELSKFSGDLSLSPESELSQVEVHRSWQALDGFFKRMCSFLNGSKFAWEDFEKEAPTLEKELDDIIRSSQTNTPYYTKIAQQLFFVQASFQQMKMYVAPLKHYERSSVPAEQLIGKVYDHNIRLLAMRNSQGVPDPYMNDFTTKVALHIEYFNFWKEKAKKYSPMHPAVQWLFDQQIAQMQSSIRDLIKYI